MRVVHVVGSLVLTGVLLCTIAVSGYELETHKKLTGVAFDQSVLGRNYLERELAVSTSTILLGPEGKMFLPSRWLQEGSVREDDFDPVSLRPLRFRHHFYDPFFNRGLTTGGEDVVFSVGLRAFDWAEEPEPIIGQEFSWRDGRRYYLAALTAEAPAERKLELARTFLTLGHVVHLVQDVGSPEHTRNDWHAGVLPPFFPFGAPSLFEVFTEGSLGAFALEGYPVPSFPRIREFWANGGQGFAEFTNRGFVTKGTNFTKTEDRATGGPYPEPVLRLEFRTDRDVAELDASVPVRGLITFFGNNLTDLNTFEILHNSRMTTYSMFDNALERRGEEAIFTLNRFNIMNAARILLPRAVGYSAGLLNHFFRGKLDVDVVEDPGDAGGLRLVGRNASTETLVDGALSVYADDARDQRVLASLPVAATVSDVAPGQDLPTVSVHPPEGAERFIAVYRGTLGRETHGPDESSPGAVIGKVIGGVRVEEVFSDGVQWKVRTPKGVFGLTVGGVPLTPTEYEHITWGDTDDLLVARTPFGSGQPNRLVAFEVPRKPGTIDFPVDASHLDVIERSSAIFPLGKLVTTVDFSHTVRVRQHLGRVDPRRFVRVWVPDPPPSAGGCYCEERLELGPLTFETIERSVEFHERIPVRLDLDHNAEVGTTIDPYYWDLADIAVDASGRLLALVTVFLNAPGSAPVDVPYFEVNGTTGVADEIDQVTVAPRFPEGVNPLLWALVDVATGNVIASTAEAEVTLALAETIEAEPWHSPNPGASLRTGIWARSLTDTRGGPQAGIVEHGWVGRILNRPEDVLAPITERTELAVEFGERIPVVGGVLRAELKEELERRGLLGYRAETTEDRRDFVYDCDAGSGCAAVSLVRSATHIVGLPVQLFDGQRGRQEAGHERVIFLGLRNEGVSGDSAHLVVWEPGSRRARTRFQLASGFHSLGPVTRASAIISARVAGAAQRDSLFIRLDDDGGAIFPGVDLTRSFRLLEPDYLYNIGDGRFYRREPPIQRTVLPAALADAPAHRPGEFHAVRIR